ncbi:hypothetical protein [Aliiroseovarius crassostreae]|uniref:hypothetical protein n=1 Tax=Aliiroseovarius crassostreae TaxID=154981 RepID=UPI001F281701|nr:hypothetical protein [Aliiroseovarius crassostreae]
MLLLKISNLPLERRVGIHSLINTLLPSVLEHRHRQFEQISARGHAAHDLFKTIVDFFAANALAIFGAVARLAPEIWIAFASGAL